MVQKKNKKVKKCKTCERLAREIMKATYEEFLYAQAADFMSDEDNGWSKCAGSVMASIEEIADRYGLELRDE